MKKSKNKSSIKPSALQKRLIIWTLSLVLVVGILQVLLVGQMIVFNVPKAIELAIIQPTLQSQNTGEITEIAPDQEQSQTVVIEEIVRKQMWIISGISLLALLVFGTFGSIMVSRRISRPLNKMTEQIATINVNSLDKRLRISGTEEEILMMTQEINRTLDRLENSFLAQDQFVANAAHELRTPLSTLLAQNQLIIAKLKTGEVLPEEVFETQKRSLKRIESIAEDLLLLTKGERQFPDESINLNELIAEICLDLAWLSQKYQVDLVFNPDEKVSITANPILIDRLIRNIILNAIQYNKPKGKVFITLEKLDAIVLMVQDTGIGISPDDLPHIFDRFYRGDPSRSRSTGGSGLGLAIVKHIITRYGGEVKVESKLNNGSCFTVLIPKSLLTD
jgi:two-component system OmpR family sensor kinase